MACRRQAHFIVRKACRPVASDHACGEVLVDHDHRPECAGCSVVITGVAAEERVGARDGVEPGLERADEITGGQPAQQLLVLVGQARVTSPASPAALLDQFLADAHADSLPQLDAVPRSAPCRA